MTFLSGLAKRLRESGPIHAQSKIVFCLGVLSGSSGCGETSDPGAVAPAQATASDPLGLTTIVPTSNVGMTTQAGPQKSSAASASGISSASSSALGPSTSVVMDCTPGSVLDCSEDSSGGKVVFPGGSPRGRCRYGYKVCQPTGTWSACQGLVGPAQRDSCTELGDDSDCNGAINEGCDCIEGLAKERPCGTDIGQCRKGTQACSNGVWGTCEGSLAPQSEICDGKGLDEDCDGKIDLEDPDCECIDGNSPCTIPGMKGDCSLGIQRCVAGKILECTAVRKAGVERCGLTQVDLFGRGTGDEDCDGLVDEESPERPLGCKMFAIDKDSDGWGAIGPSFFEDPKNATYGCFCEQPPEGLEEMVRIVEGRENKDCGDCETQDSDTVRPNQKKYFEEASACLESSAWKGGAFDYDCSGESEVKHVGKRRGRCVGDPFAGDECHWAEGSTGFWEEDVTPACGEEAVFAQCRQARFDGKTCQIGITFLYPVPQPCR